MATIRRRGVRWQVQVRRQGHAPLSKSFLSRADAEAWGRKREVELDRGEVVPSDKPLKTYTLAELLTRYLTEVTPTKRGAIPEAARLKALLRHPIADLTLDRLNAAAVASYRDERLRIVSGPSVRRELVILQSCLELARREWGIALPLNPAAAITKPVHGRGRDRRLTEEELDQLDQALCSSRNPLVREVFLFALATGMRRGEALSLQWGNVDLKSRTALLPLTKNGEARLVPLSPTALTVLVGLHRVSQRSSKGHAGASSEYVFPVSANALRLAWEGAKRRAGIKDLRFHDLRHEAISRFFEAGLSVPEVALISGHRDTRMLFRYTPLKADHVAMKLVAPSERSVSCEEER